MRILDMPLVWVIQDLVILLATVFTLRHAQKREEKPGQVLLEFFCFCFCYAAIYENGAAMSGLYTYGTSILMVGIVPLSVPALEFLVLYSALLMLEKMKVPTWCKPFVVGFWGMLQDFTLDPLAVRQVYESEGARVGRWTWNLGPNDANIGQVPVFNFPGWVLILGIGSAALLAGRWWYKRSGYRPWIGIAYPFLAALAGLIVLVLPSSQFLLWLAPFFAKGSVGEWIMLAFNFALALAVLAFAWRGRMRGALSFRGDWPVFVLPALFHAMDLCFVLVGGFFELLWIEVAFGLFHLGLIALIWSRRRMAFRPLGAAS
jgi:hypothetical protein